MRTHHTLVAGCRPRCLNTPTHQCRICWHRHGRMHQWPRTTKESAPMTPMRSAGPALLPPLVDCCSEERGGGRKREMRLGFHWINIFVACTTNESHPSQTDGSDRVVSLDQAITTAFGPIAHVRDHEVLAGSSQIWPATVRWSKFQPALPMDLRRSPIN
jgi:hypothetical protein